MVSRNFFRMRKKQASDESLACSLYKLLICITGWKASAEVRQPAALD